MCLAIPGRIVEIFDDESDLAKVDVGGVRRNVSLGLLNRDELRVGDYVLVHVGFAMSKVDEEEARKTLEILQEIGEYEQEVDQELLDEDNTELIVAREISKSGSKVRINGTLVGGSVGLFLHAVTTFF